MVSPLDRGLSSSRFLLDSMEQQPSLELHFLRDSFPLLAPPRGSTVVGILVTVETVVELAGAPEEDDVTVLLTKRISELVFTASVPPSSLADVGGLSHEKLLVGTTRNSGSRVEASTGAGTRINSGCSLIKDLTRT